MEISGRIFPGVRALFHFHENLSDALLEKIRWGVGVFLIALAVVSAIAILTMV